MSALPGYSGTPLPQKRRVGLLTAGVCLSAIMGTDLASAASQLPDEGIRRRLNGCWELRHAGTAVCFDGVDRTEITMSGEGGASASGTYTVMNGRLLFDMSPEANPSREIYPSCQIDISGEHRPVLFDLYSCLQWDLMGLPIPSRSGSTLVGDRSSKSWLDKKRYSGDAISMINAPLNGCWQALRSRERKQMVKEGIKEFGGYLSSYDICFNADDNGTTESVGCDFSDCWGDSGQFAFIDGRLALKAYDAEERCTVRIEPDRLAMFDCAVWSWDQSGKMVPLVAAEPAEFVRKEEKRL